MTRLSLVTLLLLVACGGNHPPTASFVVTGDKTVGSFLSFDASASKDPDNDALTLSWDFGDGVRGGTQRIAHSFGKAQTFTVTLTVRDRNGLSATTTQTVEVTPSKVAPQGTVSVRVNVRELNGNGINGVKIEVVDTTLSAQTGGGSATLNGVNKGVPVVYRLTKDGYIPQTKRYTHDAALTSAEVNVVMRTAEASQPLDVTKGGSLSGKEGAKITLTEKALVDDSGAAVEGEAQISLSPVDMKNGIEAFPGPFLGVDATASTVPLQSWGTTEFLLHKDGKRLNLAPGHAANVELPLSSALNQDGTPLVEGDTLPLWSFDEQAGIWIQEGEGVVVASAEAPAGFALRANVTHFSAWNCDAGIASSYNPKPKCLVDTDHDGHLEDLTGTGHCWYEGKPGFSATRQSAPLPYYSVSGSFPPSGGVPIQLPPDYDMLMQVGANNGLLTGQKMLRGSAGVIEDVEFALTPVDTGNTTGGNTGSSTGSTTGSTTGATTGATTGGGNPLTLPVDQDFSIGVEGEVDVHYFTGDPAKVYVLTVARNAGSTLFGDVLVKDNATGTVHASGSLNATALTFLVAPSTAGRVDIVVDGTFNEPGGYHLTLDEKTPTQVSLPYNAQHFVAFNENETLTFDTDPADDIVVKFRRSGPVPNDCNFGVVGGELTFAGRTIGSATQTPVFLLQRAVGVSKMAVRINRTYPQPSGSTPGTGQCPFRVSIAKVEPMNVNETQADALPLFGVRAFGFNLPSASWITVGNTCHPQGAGTGITCAQGASSINTFAQMTLWKPSQPDPASTGITRTGTGGNPMQAEAGDWIVAVHNDPQALDTDVPGFNGPPAEYQLRASTYTPPMPTLTPNQLVATSIPAVAQATIYKLPLVEGDFHRLVLRDPQDVPTDIFVSMEGYTPPDNGIVGNTGTHSARTSAGTLFAGQYKAGDIVYISSLLFEEPGDWMISARATTTAAVNAVGPFQLAAYQHQATTSINADTPVTFSTALPFDFKVFSVSTPLPYFMIAVDADPASTINPLSAKASAWGFDNISRLRALSAWSAFGPEPIFHADATIADGDRILVDWRSDAASPTIEVTLVSIEAPVGSSPLPLSTSGTIDLGEKDFYRFDTVAATEYTVQVSGAAFAGDLCAFVESSGQFGSQGSCLGSSTSPTPLASGNASVTFTASSTGPKIIQVDAAGRDTGAYTVKACVGAGPCP